MNCSACGAENAASNKFCGSCGTALAVTCGSCGTPAASGQRFCGGCGTPLASGTQTPTVGPPTSLSGAESAADVQGAPIAGREMRQVSVLFADLESFTTLAEGRDAEDVRELLSAYFDATRTVVERYGGTVEKFIGDAVMAVWGSRVSREDDTERAVRAALGVVDAVAGLSETAGISGLRVRVGVVTGQAASWGADGEGLVVGDRVNTAARIQSLADPDTVLVDDVTRNLTLASIAYSDAGEHGLKGKSEPVHVWRAERVVSGAAGSGRVDGLEARFVGREADLRLVKELFHATEERNQARLVLVAGAAGVGKSRLYAEFNRYTDGLANDCWWHVGRCLSYGDGVAYWALAEIVRQRLGIPEDAPESVVVGNLDAGLATLIRDPAVIEFVRPRLAQLLGVGDGRPMDRGDLFSGWRTFFEQLAAQNPVVLVIEDLQWADDALLDFLDHLLEWASASPIFVLAMARPELLERRSAWASSRRNITTLWLDRLSDPAISSLLEDLVPGIPDEVGSRIVERAEGVPLYALETVRSLIDRGAVVAQGGRYALVGEVSDLDIPASLTSLISARLDGLDSDERLLAMRMSVFQGGFSAEAAGAVGELEGQRLVDALSGLVRKEVFAIRSDKLSPDRGRYLFTQLLLRQVAYDMLGKRERKARHLAAAAHLRATYADLDDVSEVLAAHYRGAYEALPEDADADEVRALAVGAYSGAAERAGSLGAVDLAERAYRSAADLATSDQRPMLLEKAGMAAQHAGRYAAAEELLQPARDAYAERGEVADALRVEIEFGRIMTAVGRHREAKVLYDDIEVRAEAAGEDYARAWALIFSASVEGIEGNNVSALQRLDRGLAIAESLDARVMLGRGLVTRAALLISNGRPQESAAVLTGVLATLGPDLDLNRRATAHNNLGDTCLQSDLPGAVEHFRRSAELSVRLGDRGMEALAEANLAQAETMAGDLGGAWRRLETMLARLEASGVPVSLMQGYLHGMLGELASLRGDRAALEAAYAEADVLRESDDPADVGCYRWLGLLADRFAGELVAEPLADSVAQAFSMVGAHHEWFRWIYPDALATARSEGHHEVTEQLLTMVEERPAGAFPPFVRAQAARYRGLHSADSGDLAGAEAPLVSAIGEFERMAYPYWAACTRVDLAEVLRRMGRDEEADRMDAGGRTALTAMGVGEILVGAAGVPAANRAAYE